MTEGSGDNYAEAAAALERALLGGERQFTDAEVAQLSGVDIDRARALWRALGFADVGGDVPAFTDRDVWALKTVQSLGERGWLDDDAQVAMTRALGQSLARLADWQLAAVGSMVDPTTALDDALDRARNLLPTVEELMGYVWRRHMAAAAGRALAASVTDTPQRAASVGFADLVGFSSLTRDIDEAGLAALVEHFEGMASDIIAEGDGRIVKTIGDEVMFIADDPVVAADIGLSLSERVGNDGELPDLRVGIAQGVVLQRLGDVYGEPVNIAARLTGLARAGSVLIDRNLFTELEGNPHFALHRATPRPVRGYAMLHPYRLRRTPT